MTNTPNKKLNLGGKHFGLVVSLGLVVGTIIGAAAGNVGPGVTYGILGGALIGVVMLAVGREATL
jgi:uncharacterized membrane protein